MSETPVLVLGGGTVGHLAPGFAIAEALRAQGVGVRFATPGEPHERDWFPPEEAVPLACPALRLPRAKVGWAVFPFRLLGAVRRARRVLREAAPRVVVGLGGWPCVPGALAARSLRIPVVLLASDARPGVAVRRLQGLAWRIYAADPRAAAALGDDERVRVVGPILRRAVIAGRRDPGRFGLSEDRRTLFVTGGSLGARALNERLPAGLAAAVRAEPGLADRLQVLHAVGRTGEGVAAAYAAAGIPHCVLPFVREMGTAYRTADLVVSRAGALTCQELAAAGTPAVLVPYPHHADRQQYANAEALVDRGGAVVVEEEALTEEGVRTHVVALLEDESRLATMREAMRGAPSEGADQIAVDLVRFLHEGGSSA